MEPVQINEGDILTMKKKHPCGSNRMLVMYAASDLKLKCLGCDHIVIVQRLKIEKNIKKIQKAGE